MAEGIDADGKDGCAEHAAEPGEVVAGGVVHREDPCGGPASAGMLVRALRPARVLRRRAGGHRLYLDQGSPISSGASVNSFEIAIEHGAHGAIGQTIEELATAIHEWGFDGSRLAEVVAAVNAEAAAPGGARQAITQAPFYALEVRPAITFTQGGVRIDCDARVIGTNKTPHPRLLAAGADAGGVHAGGVSRPPVCSDSAPSTPP